MKWIALSPRIWWLTEASGSCRLAVRCWGWLSAGLVLVDGGADSAGYLVCGSCAPRALWVPGVNALGAFGRWDFLEIRDPWGAKRSVRNFLEGRKNLTSMRAAA